jgi:hypothetical protein
MDVSGGTGRGAGGEFDMTTDVLTLTEYAELVSNLAEKWDGDEEPIVLIGDRHGNVSVNADDGHTTHGTVGYAQEIFDGNGVYELGQLGDTRFYGTMLFKPSDLAEETVEQVSLNDYQTEAEE